MISHPAICEHGDEENDLCDDCWELYSVGLDSDMQEGIAYIGAEIKEHDHAGVHQRQD